MDYKNKLAQASFRGVPFGVKDIETTIGRRVQLHEYPLRDDPYCEDLGRKAREYSVNAFVMNPNDYSQSKALVAALSDYSTPGTLVHPTLGIMQVVPKECSHRYSSSDGGIEYFSVTFVETLGNNFPNVVVDTRSFARSTLTTFLSDSQTYFSSKFRVSGYADFIAQAAVENLDSFVSKFRGLINFGSARNGNPNQYSKLIYDLGKFSDNLATLVFTPEDLAEQLNELNRLLNASFSDNLGLAMLIQRRLWEFGDDFLLIIATTNLRAIQGQNQDQVISLVKNAVLAEMVRNVSLATFKSYEDAIALRDDIDERAWTQLEVLADSFDDTIYTSLLKTTNSMISDVKARAASSATTREFTIADSVPALVVAYKYLGDATKDQDIIDRNNIQNPLFIPPNSEIKVVI